jgi:hypothetical protein
MTKLDRTAIVLLFSSVMLRVIAQDFGDIWKFVALMVFAGGAFLLSAGGAKND